MTFLVSGSTIQSDQYYFQASLIVRLRTAFVPAFVPCAPNRKYCTWQIRLLVLACETKTVDSEQPTKHLLSYICTTGEWVDHQHETLPARFASLEVIWDDLSWSWTQAATQKKPNALWQLQQSKTYFIYRWRFIQTPFNSHSNCWKRHSWQQVGLFSFKFRACLCFSIRRQEFLYPETIPKLLKEEEGFWDWSKAVH